MPFDHDKVFSKHKDLLLKDYWGRKSFEGRFVITGSDFLQKTHGIDIILQTGDDVTDVKIDTKHVKREYPRLFMEEWSNTNPGREKLGWLLKEDGHPDYIMHVFNPLCDGCYDNCFVCQLPIREKMTGWMTPFKPLREWYMRHMNNADFQRDFHVWRNTKKTEINNAAGRSIPITTLKKMVGTWKCLL